jgi:hypothetical protein
MSLANLSTLLIKIRGPAGQTANDGGGFKARNGMSLTGSEGKQRLCRVREPLATQRLTCWLSERYAGKS